MIETYFSKFPQIIYNNTVTRNITERVSIVSGSNRIPTNYYPYELIDGLRADLLADSYYKDSAMDWLIYLTNGITDPYYDWYMGTSEFNTYLETKYGSIENAENTVLYYRSNWSDDPINMTVSAFKSQTPAIQKYYIPNFGVNNTVLNYSRRQEDWTASTNQIVSITCTAVSDTSFNEGEVVNIYDPINVIGRGVVCLSNSTVLQIQHVTGNNSVTGYTVKGRDSGATAVIATSVVSQYVIPLSEQRFYSPVTAYDKENEKNESQKFIYLLNSGNALETAESIRKQLNG